MDTEGRCGDVPAGCFIPKYEQLRPFLVNWTEDGTMVMPSNLPPGVKPDILVTHDESTFNANGGKRKLKGHARQFRLP